jgi:hypothetical protein
MFYALSALYKYATKPSTPTDGSTASAAGPASPANPASGNSTTSADRQIGGYADNNKSPHSLEDNRAPSTQINLQNQQNQTNEQKPATAWEIVYGIGKSLIEWGVLILMMVLPGMIPNYGVIFGIISGIALAGFCYQVCVLE